MSGCRVVPPPVSFHSIPFHSIPSHLPFHFTSVALPPGCPLGEDTAQSSGDGMLVAPACRTTSLRWMSTLLWYSIIPFHSSFHSNFHFIFTHVL